VEVAERDLPETVGVVERDTLASIAWAHDLSVPELADWNAEADILATKIDDVDSAPNTIVIPGHVRLGSATAATDTIKERDTLATIAGRNDTTEVALGRANQHLVGLLQPGFSLTYPGASGSVTILENDTLSTILARFRAPPYSLDIDIANLAEAIKDASCLQYHQSPERRLLIPPPEVTLQTGAVTPDFPDILFPLSVELVISRPDGTVDERFDDAPGVKMSSTPLRPERRAQPQVGGARADEILALREFAVRFEKNFTELKLATGVYAVTEGAQPTSSQLLAVQFNKGNHSFTIQHQTPYFFAPRALTTRLWSASDVPIWPYQGDIKLEDATQKTVSTRFQDVDPDAWMRDFLAAVDRFLSSEYAAAAYKRDPSSYETVVRAKDVLADQLAALVEEIVASAPAAGQAGPDRDAARKLFGQYLRIRLSTAYTVDAIVQFPVMVKVRSRNQDLRHRLSGQMMRVSYTLPSEGATLASVARHFGAPTDILARQIAGAALVLKGGSALNYNTASYTVKENDTLQAIAGELSRQLGSQVTVAQLATNGQIDGVPLADSVALLRPGADLGLITRTYTIVQDETDQDGVSLRDVVDYLAPRSTETRELYTALAVFAAMNAKVGLFASDPQNDTIENVAQQSGIPLSELIAGLLDPPADDTPEHDPALEQRLAAQRELAVALLDRTVVPGAVVSFLTSLPPFSLSEAKVEMPLTGEQQQTSALTFFFQTGADAQNSNLATELAYRINEIEYHIRGVSFAEKYEASDWLSFILPPADVPLGVVDIPIPLRAYPFPPVVRGQASGPSEVVKADPDRPLRLLKAYRYEFSFDYQPADQDQLIVEVETSQGGALHLQQQESSGIDELAQALAQYASVAESLNRDLAILPTLKPEGNDPTVEMNAKNAVVTFAHLVQTVADTWTASQSDQPESIAPRTQRLFSVRHRLGTDGTISALVRGAGGIVAETGSAPQPMLLSGEVEESAEAPKPQQDIANGYGRVSVDPLNIIAHQYIRSLLKVTRNERLLAGHTTNPFFVYRTPDILTAKAIPHRTYREQLDVAVIPGPGRERRTLAGHLVALLRNLVALPEGNPGCMLRIAVSYGFVLAGQAAHPNIMTYLPVLLKPNFSFDPENQLSETQGLCHDLAEELKGWLSDRRPVTTGGVWVFDVSVYTGVSEQTGQA
ncbi:MAG TPA: LysM domain-containing protein, partial [Roseiflexaceae bacterium]